MHILTSRALLNGDISYSWMDYSNGRNDWKPVSEFKPTFGGFLVNNNSKKSATRGNYPNKNTTIQIYWTLMVSRTTFGTSSFSKYLRYNSSDVLIAYRCQTCERKVIPTCLVLLLPLTLHDGRRHDTSAVSSASAFRADQPCAERVAYSSLFLFVSIISHNSHHKYL